MACALYPILMAPSLSLRASLPIATLTRFAETAPAPMDTDSFSTADAESPIATELSPEAFPPPAS